MQQVLGLSGEPMTPQCITTNQRAALLTEQLTAHSIYSERWQGAEGGSSPPTAPIPFIKATFTHNFPSEPVRAQEVQGRARWFRISHLVEYD